MKKTYSRREVLAAGAAASAVAAFPATGSAQAIERKKVTIAVGGKNLLYYLPLTIAEQKKLLRGRGPGRHHRRLRRRRARAAGRGRRQRRRGLRRLRAQHQHAGQGPADARLRAAGPRTADRARASAPKTMPNFKSVADLKGKKIGVTAPGSSTNILCNFVLAKAGLKPSDVSYRRRRRRARARWPRMRAGQIDAISQPRPGDHDPARAATTSRSSPTRAIVAEADKVFGGPMPAGRLYAPQSPSSTRTRTPCRR